MTIKASCFRNLHNFSTLVNYSGLLRLEHALRQGSGAFHLCYCRFSAGMPHQLSTTLVQSYDSRVGHLSAPLSASSFPSKTSDTHVLHRQSCGLFEQWYGLGIPSVIRHTSQRQSVPPLPAQLLTPGSYQ